MGGRVKAKGVHALSSKVVSWHSPVPALLCELCAVPTGNIVNLNANILKLTITLP